MIMINFILNRAQEIKPTVHNLLAALICATAGGCASAPQQPEVDLQSWALKFDRPIAFQTLVDEDLLVVGTLRHLYGVNPESGERLWRQRNIAATRHDLVSMPQYSYLLLNDAAGGLFDDRDTHILALDKTSGEIVWESDVLDGKVLQAALNDPRDVFYTVTVPRAHGDDRGFMSGTLGRKGLGSGFEQVPILSATEIASGRRLWTQSYPEKVLMRPSYSPQLDDRSDWSYTRPFDLQLYHPPLITAGMICLTYTGIRCFDAAAGTEAWAHEFDVVEGKLARSYANPLLQENTIYAAGDRRVRAFDRKTGEKLWASEKFDIISELQADDFLLYGQLGGQFFNIKKEKWVWEGKFGAFAIDRASGETMWKYDDGDDALTNLLVYAGEVWLADEKHLIALDRFTGTVKVEIEHDFKDSPVYVALNETGDILLVGENEAAAFKHGGGEVQWYVRHEPFGPSAWRRFANGMLHASGNVLKFTSFVLSRGVGLLPSLAIPIGGIDFKLINTKKIVSNSLSRSGRRLTYQTGGAGGSVGNVSLSGNFQYFVTRDKRTKKAVLAVVNLSTGETERMLKSDSATPNLVIDEGNNKIYEMHGQQLHALTLDVESKERVVLSPPANSDRVAESARGHRPLQINNQNFSDRPTPIVHGRFVK